MFQDPVVDKQLRMLSGKVVYHSKDKAEVYRKAMELPPPRRVAVLFVGKPEKNIAYML